MEQKVQCPAWTSDAVQYIGNDGFIFYDCPASF